MDKYEPTFTSSEGEEDDESSLRQPVFVSSSSAVPQEAEKELLNCKSCHFPIPPEEVHPKNRKHSRKVSFAKGTKGKKGWQTYSGILLALGCCLAYATVGLIVKYLKEYNALNLAFFRFAGMTVPSLPILAYLLCVKKVSLVSSFWPPTDPPKAKVATALLGRSFVGFVAVILHFYAIQYLTVADAMTIGSCTPVFVTLAAHVFLGEKCGIFPIAAAVLTITGVGIIARPPLLTGADNFDTDVLIGTAFAFGKMLFSSLAIVFIRYLRKVHVGVVLFVSGLLALLQTASAAFATGVFDLTFRPHHLPFVLLLAVASFLGQLFLVLALKCEKAGPFSVLMASDSIFAFVLQFVFLGTVPDAFSLIGATLLIAVVCLTVLRKWVTSLPEDAPSRRTFRFLLI